jgi:Tol biopolymer transport system component
MTSAIDKRGEESMLALYGRSYESSGSPVYTADGRHVAFKVMKSSKMGVAIDDQEDAACEYTFVDALAPNPDGSAVAFVASNGCKLSRDNGQEVLRGVTAKGGQWFVVFGSTRRGEYEIAHSPIWSPDGRDLAYAARSKGQWRVYAGSKQSLPCDEVARIVWSEDGSAVSYGCRRGAEVLWCRLEAG